MITPPCPQCDSEMESLDDCLKCTKCGEEQPFAYRVYDADGLVHGDIPIQDCEYIIFQERMTIEEASRRYPDASGLSDEALNELADEIRRREETP